MVQLFFCKRRLLTFQLLCCSLPQSVQQTCMCTRCIIQLLAGLFRGGEVMDWLVLTCFFHCCSTVFQQSEVAVPQSLFKLFPFSATATQNASLILKMSSLLARSSIVVFSHAGWCCSSQACSATADLSTSPNLVAYWCSFRRVPRALLVSPIYWYSFPQLHGILYTTLPCSILGPHPLLWWVVAKEWKWW